MISTLSRRTLTVALRALAIDDFRAFYAFAREAWPQVAGSLRTDTPDGLVGSLVDGLVARGLVSRETLAKLDARYGDGLGDLRVLREELGDAPLYTQRDPGEIAALVEACVALKLYEPFPVASLRTDYGIAERVSVDYGRDPVRWLRQSAERANHAETPDLIARWVEWATRETRKLGASVSRGACPAPVVIVMPAAAVPVREPPPYADRWWRLHALLGSAFSAEELVRIVRHMPGGGPIVARIPSRASLAETVDAVIAGVREAERLADLLHAIQAERPRRAGEIEAIRAMGGR